MKRALATVVLTSVFAAAMIGFFPNEIKRALSRFTPRTTAGCPPVTPEPDPEINESLKASLGDWRAGLAARYHAAATEAERKAILDDARIVLEEALPAMMRTWLGTPWDFNGTAATPGDGKIACGYFVSTVLQDAGFKVHRYRLAQQPSENILRTFLPRSSCKLSVGVDYDVFADQLSSSEPGIYIAGLDTHVGFLVVKNGGFRFIHASGSSPWQVVDESRIDARVLQSSNWRMIGNLTADKNALHQWLIHADFPVHGAR